MAGWIKSLRQHDGSFVIVIPREVYGTDGRAAIIEDFATRASPLEFANAILRAHGVEPAHVFAAYPASDPGYVHNLAVAPIAPANIAEIVAGSAYITEEPYNRPPNCDGHHATFAPMPAFDPLDTSEGMCFSPDFDPEQDDDEGAPGEPPRCKTGGCD